MLLKVSADGTLVFIYDDELRDLTELGPCCVARASHVEPDNVCGLACWRVDLSPVGGPMLGPFKFRCDALAAEREWLDAHLYDE